MVLDVVMRNPSPNRSRLGAGRTARPMGPDTYVMEFRRPPRWTDDCSSNTRASWWRSGGERRSAARYRRCVEMRHGDAEPEPAPAVGGAGRDGPEADLWARSRSACDPGARGADEPRHPSHGGHASCRGRGLDRGPATRVGVRAVAWPWSRSARGSRSRPRHGAGDHRGDRRHRSCRATTRTTRPPRGSAPEPASRLAV